MHYRADYLMFAVVRMGFFFFFFIALTYVHKTNIALTLLWQAYLMFSLFISNCELTILYNGAVKLFLRL